jgi:hypothetical protein
MSTGNDQLAKAVRHAAQDGEIVAPAGLIAAIAKFEKPLQALQDTDEAWGIFEAVDKEFGFIRFSFMDNRAVPTTQIQPTDQIRYVSLLRWLIRELRTLRQADDARHDKIVAAFIVAQMCDSNNGLWDLLPNDIGENVDLLDYLKGLIASFAVAFNSRPGAQVPIWEGEAVEAFKRADAEDDWVAIISGWKLFHRHPFFPNTLQLQSVRLLYRYSFARLLDGLSKLTQTPVAMQLAVALTVEKRFRLAVASDNSRIQIAALYRALTDERGLQPFTDFDRTLLTELLLKVANDTPRWAAWMKVFVGYPAINLPLGRALAKVPDPAIDGYINSIRLYPKLIQPLQPVLAPDTGRRSVAECLREFRTSATPERRTALWTCAHERWLLWDFNRADSNQHLTAISRSDLDYALVGYASECMGESEREAALNSIRAEVQTLEHHWHESIMDILAGWYRLLSRFQPYGHACSMAANGEDWLTESRVYFPFEPSQNSYLMMMYNMTWPQTAQSAQNAAETSN